MEKNFDQIIEIARNAFEKLHPDLVKRAKAEEVELDRGSGHWFVTISYWERDSKPAASPKPSAGTTFTHLRSLTSGDSMEDLLHPWRRRFKRIEVDPDEGRAVSIKMYAEPLAS